MKRMLKRRFASYLLLIAAPLVIFGFVLIVYPAGVLSRPPFMDPKTGLLAAASFLARGAGAGIILIGIMIARTRHNPDQSRDTILWLSLYLVGMAVLLALGPFQFQLSMWTLAPASFFLVSGVFLFLYASRNIIVRE
ncbi:MAG: hypothetical protein HY042_05825 [Spirochaetia bacterium]|nr:hypothetical protein [Spirochaetia bacterium]